MTSSLRRFSETIILNKFPFAKFEIEFECLIDSISINKTTKYYHLILVYYSCVFINTRWNIYSFILESLCTDWLPNICINI